MEKDAKVFIAGHDGMVGSALIHCLEKMGFTNLITRTSAQLNLIDQAQVRDFFLAERPDFIFLVAGKVGGILANKTYPAEFIYNNLLLKQLFLQ